MKKKILILITIFLTITKVKAFSSSLTGPKTVSPGQEFVIKYYVNTTGIQDVKLENNGLTYGPYYWLDNTTDTEKPYTFHIKVKAPIAPGNYTVTVSGYYSTVDFKRMTDNKSFTYQVLLKPKEVNKPHVITTPKKDNNQIGLKMINIKDIKTFVPKEGDNYINVGNLKEVNISGVKHYNNDIVTGFGTFPTNQNHTITVKSKGRIIKYNLIFERDIKSYIKINNLDYEVVGGFKYLNLDELEIKINEKVHKVYGSQDKYLLKVKDNDQEKVVMYDKGNYYFLAVIDNLILENVSKIEHYKLTNKIININDVNIKSYEYVDNKDLYLVNVYKKKGFYIYNKNNNSLTPYIYLDNKTKEKEVVNASIFNILNVKNKQVPLVFMLIVLLLLLIHLIIDVIFIIKRNKSNIKNVDNL